MIEIGDKAPHFSLPNQSGELVSLDDYKGKWLVLYFYPKDDTPGCTKEACDFTDELAQFQNLDAVVLGVSQDNADSHQKFIRKYAIGIDLLSDPDRIAHQAYGAWGMKKQYGKEYEGTIRSTFLIDPAGKVAHTWRNVRVRTKSKQGEIPHAQVVKEKLADLQGK